MTSPPRTDFPGLRHIILLLPWMVVGISARAPIRDNSFLWHVRAGTLQLDRGSVLTSDPFSFNSPEVVWRTQSWLADAGYGWLERLTELGFVWPLILSLGTLLLLAIGLLFRQQSKSLFWNACLLTASAIVLAPYLNPRPALFSLLLFAVVVMVALKRQLWWALPLVTWIWASLHGAWPLGVLFVLLWAVYRRDWRLGQQIVPMSLAALFTAHGWAVLEILIDFVRSRESLALITEWAPTNLASLPGFIFLLALVFSLVGQRVGGARVLWLLIPFLYVAVSSTRSLPFGWLALVPLLALAAEMRADPAILTGETRGRRIVNTAIGLGLLVLPFVVARAPGLDSEHFPIVAATRLSSLRTFHDDTTGGYLIYGYGPGKQVYIDDRAELFGEKVAEFIRIRNGDGRWKTEFARLGIEEALLKKTDPLLDALTSAGWVESFADEIFVVLEAPTEGG